MRTDPPMMAVVCWVPSCRRLKVWKPGPAGSVSHGICRHHYLDLVIHDDTYTMLEWAEWFVRRWWWLLAALVGAVAW